ncbi:MAG: hypothetical protein A2Z16_07115 [Chloroflexi bacterium RBG_16_54_18]|nr:MAG: hypothetical protein A2Z16_07115 [Chloroflexi bacterium RBG_16_54_18]
MRKERSFPEQAVDKARKTYIKPVLSKIRLVAEEAVLATCKYGTGGIGGYTICQTAGDLTCVATARS